MVDENMDPGDSILVAAANSNGYLFYKINSIDGIISGLTEQNHHSNQEMDTENGSDEAHSVILSTNHNIAFVMDKGLHHIWVYKYGEDASYTENYLQLRSLLVRLNFQKYYQHSTNCYFRTYDRPI